MLPYLFIGTSGWSYPWKDWFYPAGLKPAGYLAYYATRFNAVEINSSFYHFTQPKTVANWLALTPPSFRFAPKMNRELTHIHRLAETGELLDAFMSRFLPMGGRLGPMLIQLPGSLAFDAAVAANFFKILREKYPAQGFALEARHSSWFGEAVLGLLREHRIAWVVASAGRRFPKLETSTADLAYLRLHGDEKLYASAYPAEELEQYGRLVRTWLDAGKEVWVFFNNTMNGHAVANAETLRDLLNQDFVGLEKD